MDINDVKVYIGKYSGGVWTWTNINGYSLDTGRVVYYRKCEGLESYGKAKNIYTETYADSDVVRTDFPTTIQREATTITLDLIVKRDPSISVGDGELGDIIGLVSGNYPTVFWDNVRHKMAVMTLINAAEVKEDNYKGMKYLEVELKLNNLMGYCPVVGEATGANPMADVETAALPIITKILA